MKKGLMISLMAIGALYAGGDIAPVTPVTPQVAPAACDFWGQVGFRYEAYSDENGDNLFDTDFNKAKAVIILGLEKDLSYGFGLGAEIAAKVSFDGKLENSDESTELSQLYLTYKNGDTKIKAGRQAISKSISPWAWSDRSLGQIDNSFNAITLVNSSLKDTKLFAAWIASVSDKTSNKQINGSNLGMFMLGVNYTGLKDTTLSTNLYYIPKNDTYGKAYSIWSSIKTKVSGVDLGMQAVYAKADANSFALHEDAIKTDATYALSAFVGTKFNKVNTKLTLSYINDGDASLNLGGTSGFWGDSVGSAIEGEVVPGNKQIIAALSLAYKIDGYGKVYSDLAIDKPDSGENMYAARVGYKFNIGKVKAKVEYRYVNNKDFVKDKKQHRIRVEGVYKF